MDMPAKMDETTRSRFQCHWRQKHANKTLLFSRSQFVTQLTGQDVDSPDRLPPSLLITRLDLLFMAIAVVAYIADIFSDVLIACFHIYNDRVLVGVLVLGFTIIPSLLLNLLSYVWYDTNDSDNMRYPHGLICALQLGPLMYHINACRYAYKVHTLSSNDDSTAHRHELFARMIITDRDATILRLFEAFMEAAPQLLIQTYAFAYVTTPDRIFTTESAPQIASILLSLLSLAWGLVAQHRSLRLAREDKRNMNEIGMLMQFLWRVFSLIARILAIVTFAMVFPLYCTISCCVLHVIVSIIHLSIFQHVDVGGSWWSEVIVVAIGGWLHLFTPFNMAEGRTRWRYIGCYTLEVCENTLLLCFAFKYSGSIPILYIFAISSLSFLMGIIFMCLYYRYCHPTLTTGRWCYHTAMPECVAVTLNTVNAAEELLN